MSELHPADRLDALEWAIQQIRSHSPEYAANQIARNNMFALQQMKDEAQREARK